MQYEIYNIINNIMCIIIIYYGKITGKLFTITSKNLYIFDKNSLNSFKQSYYTTFQDIYYRKKDINILKKNKIIYHLLKLISRFYPIKNNEINDTEIKQILNNELCFYQFHSFISFNI
jgi:hypothetical protein